jgi:hypothetical protein
VGSLSWANWKRYCRCMMVFCLILALYFGGAWYVDLQTAELAGPRHPQSRPAGGVSQPPVEAPPCDHWESYFPVYCEGESPDL